MVGGYVGRIGFVDLSSGEVFDEVLEDHLCRDFIGGYGIGARVLFERQPKGIDPLGPENTLGFTTGPLTGTKTPTGGRYMAVCKSPLTGGWGDANAGGYFGSALKAAGWDAVFVRGQAPGPRYVLVTNQRIEVRDAGHLWGKDTALTEETLRRELGGSRLRVACIGEASERLSLISGIVNDRGRVAARSGVGAVMGSKRLKAVAVIGKGRVPVARQDRLNELRRKFADTVRNSSGFPRTLVEHGTCGITGPLLSAGGTPVKNWLLAGEQAFPTSFRITDPEEMVRYQVRKYGCGSCPIACGGILEVQGGPYPVKEAHKPEYETLSAFGTMCLNDDLPSIIKLNDMCNRSGLDTISAGTVIAFAMECYEHGVITRREADGIELSWGNKDAMVALLEKIIRREGIGDILADGVKVASRKIGRGAEAYAMHVGGQEPGFHNALFLPGRATGLVADPTPGRHTATPMSRIDAGVGGLGPYPELHFGKHEQYEYKNKGPASAVASCYLQVGTCSGVCLFPLVFFGDYPLLDYLGAVTGWEVDVKEALETGHRIQTLRQCFTLREVSNPEEVTLPPRLAGIPPKTEGPLAGITIDAESLVKEYRKAMGWEEQKGLPLDATLERLGLKKLVETHG